MARFSAINCHDVEANYRIGVAFGATQEKCGASDYFSLLRNADGLESGGETVPAAKTHFDENQAIAVMHYQVNFAKAAEKIALQTA